MDFVKGGLDQMTEAVDLDKISHDDTITVKNT